MSEPLQPCGHTLTTVITEDGKEICQLCITEWERDDWREAYRAERRRST